MVPALPRLTKDSLASALSGVKLPEFDRTTLKIGVVHIGVGNFHRAHEAVYLDRVNATRGGGWGIAGLNLRSSGSRLTARLQEQDGLYSVTERDGDRSATRVVGSLVRAVDSFHDPEAALNLLANPSTQIVSLTVTEGGYGVDGLGRFDESHPDIAADLRTPHRPTTFMGILTAGLRLRRDRTGGGVTVLSCDNIIGNGLTAKKALIAFAALTDSSLAQWIEREVTFPNSMVDRITPRTTQADLDFASSAIGLRDECAVTCETYLQWIVEEAFAGERPRWEEVGVQMTNDVRPYEEMKLRVLNAGHSALGYLGYLAGHRLVYEAARDADFIRYLHDLHGQEVLPYLPPVPGIDLESYRQQVIDRFANTAIQDDLLRICMDGSAKIARFIVPSLRDAVSERGDVRRLCLCIAAWIRFLRGKDEAGVEIPIVDPEGPRLQAVARTVTTDPLPFLKLQDIFGSVGTSPAVVAAVSRSLGILDTRGARAALQELV